MARPRTPTNILDARGSFDKHPERRREEPEPAGELGEPPNSLRAAEKRVWYELQENAPKGVLTAGDRFAVELICVLMREFRAKPSEFTAAKYTRLHGLLGSVGLTPADRSKVSGTKTKAKDDWADL